MARSGTTPHKAALTRYLGQRSEHRNRQLFAADLHGIEQVVVIPAVAEEQQLPATLADLSLNEPEQLARTLVLIVVNNRAEPHAPPAHRDSNQRTLRQLADLASGKKQLPGPGGELRLAWVDAASPGRELGPRQGVGAARRIGLDHGLAVLAAVNRGQGLLLSLDADTRVDPGYLTAVDQQGRQPGFWAAVVEHEHPVPAQPDAAAAIISYEIFLRAVVLGLRWAGSPYAYHAIGSTMVCSTDAYVAVGGMNRRQAGEDYYFLQQLAKTGTIGRILTTRVRPSPRSSRRVPFGTGASIAAFLEHGHRRRPYHPASYEVLRRWLTTMNQGLDLAGDELLERAVTIAPELGQLLRSRGLVETWPRLQANASSSAQLRAQAHRWFDAFATLKLLHHLRDHGSPAPPVATGLQQLLDLVERPLPTLPWSRFDNELELQQLVLEHLRTIDRQLAVPMGCADSSW